MHPRNTPRESATRSHASIYVLAAVASLATAVSAAAAGPSSPDGLRRSEPIQCSGSTDIVLHGRFIETDGNAVEVYGNCDVVIRDSYIVAGGVAVLASGNGDAKVFDSYIEGDRGALLATGNGDIEYAHNELVGGVLATGNGELDDGGGNYLEGRVTAAGAGSGESIRISEGSISVGGVRIDTGGVTVEGQGERVHVRTDSRGVVVDDGNDRVSVRTGGDGVVVDDGSGAVSVRTGADGSVRIDAPGAQVEISDDWRRAGSVTVRETERLLDELGAVVEGRELRLDLAGDVLFDFDSAAIHSEAATELGKVGAVIRARAEGDVHIVGHTDSVGDDTYNQKLSERRAIAVMHWLNRQEGIPAHLMVGRGLGASKPIAHNTMPDGSDNPAGRAQNRRVEIRFAVRE